MSNQKQEAPLEYYRAKYKLLDPDEAVKRTNLAFDARSGRFTLNCLGHTLYASWPEFSLTPDDVGRCPKTLYSFTMQILVARFLIEGAAAPSDGRFKAYRELPWGDLYDANFRGRCIRRLASAFGNKPAEFAKAAELLGGVKLGLGDVSYDLPFLGGVVCRLILWRADDEFPPSAQFLFSGNTPAAFNAEDLAGVGDVVIGTLSAL